VLTFLTLKVRVRVREDVNAVIAKGVSIGDGCVIGANSVVTQSIPERSIAVGAPARVIKQWDEKSRRWRPYDPSPRDAVVNLG